MSPVFRKVGFGSIAHIHREDDVRAMHGIFNQTIIWCWKGCAKAKNIDMGPAWNHQIWISTSSSMNVEVPPLVSGICQYGTRFFNHRTEAIRKPNSSVTKKIKWRHKGTNSSLRPMLKPDHSQHGHVKYFNTQTEVRDLSHSLSYCWP